MYYSRCVHTPPPSLLLLVAASRTLTRTVQLSFSWNVSNVIVPQHHLFPSASELAGGSKAVHEKKNKKDKKHPSKWCSEEARQNEEAHRYEAYELYQGLVNDAIYPYLSEDDFFIKDPIGLCKRAPSSSMPQALSCWKEYYQREYTVDSGASYHTISEQDLTAGEWKSMRLLDEPVTMQTCNGEVEAEHEAEIFVHDLEIIITALVVPSDTPPLISVGKLIKKYIQV